MSAPEEIHIKPNRDYTSIWGRPIITDPFDDDPETEGYIRHDVHHAAVAAARAEGWNAAIKAAADEVEEHKHFAKGIDCCAECIRKMARPKAQP